jgi:hypothetical protein
VGWVFIVPEKLHLQRRPDTQYRPRCCKSSAPVVEDQPRLSPWSWSHLRRRYRRRKEKEPGSRGGAESSSTWSRRRSVLDAGATGSTGGGVEEPSWGGGVELKLEPPLPLCLQRRRWGMRKAGPCTVFVEDIRLLYFWITVETSSNFRLPSASLVGEGFGAPYCCRRCILSLGLGRP